MSKLVRNEKLKLRASIINNISIGVFIAFLVAAKAADLPFLGFMGAMCGVLLAAIVLHWFAEYLLNGLEE
jgi:Flp pilus assembly protein protease CpaA